MRPGVELVGGPPRADEALRRVRGGDPAQVGRHVQRLVRRVGNDSDIAVLDARPNVDARLTLAFGPDREVEKVTIVVPGDPEEVRLGGAAALCGQYPVEAARVQSVDHRVTECGLRSVRREWWVRDDARLATLGDRRLRVELVEAVSGRAQERQVVDRGVVDRQPLRLGSGVRFDGHVVRADRHRRAADGVALFDGDAVVVTGGVGEVRDGTLVGGEIRVEIERRRFPAVVVCERQRHVDRSVRRLDSDRPGLIPIDAGLDRRDVTARDLRVRCVRVTLSGVATRSRVAP